MPTDGQKSGHFVRYEKKHTVVFIQSHIIHGS